jgi:hypothetical protein
MGKVTPIFLAIITSFTANSFAFGQTAPELPQLITQLHDPVTSDEASIKLKALAANNADARRVLVKELPESLSQRLRKIRRNMKSGSILFNWQANSKSRKPYLYW